MTPGEAMKILDLKGGFSIDDVKTAYKMKSREHHPDRGGDVAKMQGVNVAFETLYDKQRNQLKVQTFDPADREAARSQRAELSKIYAQVARDATEHYFKVERFTSHFDKVFGTPFKFSGGWHKSTTYYQSDDSITWNGEWSNVDRTIVLDLQIVVYFDDLFKGRFLSTSEAETALKMYVATAILHNRKKVKLSQANYKFTASHDVLSNPEVVFPSSKMATQSAKAAERKLQKRDIFLTFQSELEGKASGDEWMYIPVGQYKVALTRNVFFKMGSWSINGVYGAGGKRLGQTQGYTTWLEQPEDMNHLWDGLKALQRQSDPTVEQIVAKLNAMQVEQRNRVSARSAK